MKRKIALIFGLIGIIAGLNIIYFFAKLHGISWDKFWGLATGFLLLSSGISLFLKQGDFFARLSRVFVGLIFLYSGFVKAVDPLGSNYKFIDYFDAWGLHSLAPTALILSFILSMAEFVIGGLLLFNVLTKLGSWLALIFMVLFTPITFYLATQQQLSGHEFVHDCGCFGDALILTNWQTFWKNILLLIPAIYLFIKREKLHSNSLIERMQYSLVGIMCSISLLISWYGYEHLPIIDFRPYKIGTHIPTAMSIPKGAPQPEYEYHLLYKKKATGEIKEFNLQNYPQDSTWEFVDSKNVLVKEGYTPSITGFTISGDEGDITEQVLADTGLVFMVVEYDITKSDEDVQSELNTLCNQAMKDKHRVLALSASLKQQIDPFVKKHNVKYPFYMSDPITLKTVVRSNPGLVLLKNGKVLKNWHYNDLPNYKSIIKTYNGNK